MSPVSSSSLPEDFSVTVIVQLASFPPSSVVTVITALPAATAVTVPSLTVATFSALELQLTFLLSALVGSIVSVS